MRRHRFSNPGPVEIQLERQTHSRADVDTGPCARPRAPASERQRAHHAPRASARERARAHACARERTSY